MKTILMTLLFVSGFAANQLDAQICCTPCPPGCCITTSNADGTTTFTHVKDGAKITCTPEQMKACTPEQMKACSPEQMKACSPKQVQGCNKGAAFGTATIGTFTDVHQVSDKSVNPAAKKGTLQE